MFLIRTNQEARLKEGARSAFVSRVEKHVVAAHPKETGALDPANLRQFVERNWEVARTFGLISERALCQYLDAVCKLGEDFPTKFEWATSVLKSAEYEDKKLAQLRRQVEASSTPTAA